MCECIVFACVCVWGGGVIIGLCVCGCVSMCVCMVSGVCVCGWTYTCSAGAHCRLHCVCVERLHWTCCTVPLQGADGERDGESREEDRSASGGGFFACLSVEYYQKFFDVSTMEVRKRRSTFFVQLGTVLAILGAVSDSISGVACVAGLLFSLLWQTEIKSEFLCATLRSTLCV